MAAETAWRVLAFIPSGPYAALYEPFAVWEAARGDVTVAGASPELARERLDAAVAAGEEA